MLDKKYLTLFSYLLHLLYMRYWSYFLLHMVFHFYKFKRRKKSFSIKSVSNDFFYNLVEGNKIRKNNIDINNTVILNSCILYPNEKLINLTVRSKNARLQKTAALVKGTFVNLNVILVSETFMFNLRSFFNEEDTLSVEMIETAGCKKFASDVEISFIYNPTIDLSVVYIDSILENYFAVPRLVYQNDVLEIPLNMYGQHISYSKLHGARLSLYFKYKKVVFENKEVHTGLLCSRNETTLRQMVNCQAFLPIKRKRCCFFLSNTSPENDEVSMYPDGLRKYFAHIKKSLKPFLKRNVKLPPIFLIQGSKGCGKNILLSSLASDLGLNYYNVNSIDLTANVYAQNETKLRNIFFNAKISAPCLLAIHEFENFGVNNEGEYDERLMGFFISEVLELFENNNFPVFLFCCSNSHDLPMQLKRLFLDIFTIDHPTPDERKLILTWLLKLHGFGYDELSIKDMSEQTNGFLYEDLKALVNTAYLHNIKFKENHSDAVFLLQKDFYFALEKLQTSYNENLGAPKVPKVKWTDIGGLGEVKEEIVRTISLPLKHPELLATGLRRSGILLFGPPGTGKTLLAKAVATECGLCFLSVKGPELLNMYVGQSEQNVRQVFEKARQASPCIIFFDELDSLAPYRGKSGDSGGVMDRIVSQLLAEMDGLNESNSVFIIGATNRPDLIDQALLRPGRFDKLLYVGPCTNKNSKLSVLKALTQRFNMSEDVDLEKVVTKWTDTLTGADCYGVCATAWMLAVRRIVDTIEQDRTKDLKQSQVKVNMEDFLKALKSVKPSINKNDLLYFNSLKGKFSSL